MKTYIQRFIEKDILYRVERYPAVVIVGPRQAGKTSLVKHISNSLGRPAIYLDLEYPEDINKLSNPTLYLESVKDQTVIIDEVQRMPGLFPILRALIDRDRRPGRFILLGSASPDVIRDTSESLAGRVAYMELSPFILQELSNIADYQALWIRGGFPESLLAENDQDSFDWRGNFIQSYLERDIPLLGLKADPMLIRRLWTMLAHMNGQPLNLENIARSLGITASTVRRYIDFLESAFLIRRLQPFHANIKKRLVKSPKVFIRDTGVLHSLLNIQNLEELMGNPMLGNSWEAFILQQIAAKVPARTELFYYRTQDGTKADIVIAPGGVPEVMVEVKFTSTPKPGRGFYEAGKDLNVRQKFIVCPTSSSYPLAENVMVLSYHDLDQIFS